MLLAFYNKPLPERIAEIQATIALVERYEKLYHWARSLTLHMRECGPGSYAHHDLLKGQRDEFDTQALATMRELRESNYYVRSMTPNENRYNLLAAVQELSEPL